jgi:hypothetical protein
MAKLNLLIPHYAHGTLTAEFGSSDTVAESAEFAGLPTVGTDEFYRITFDPDGENGVPEVVDFPTHSAASDEMTCTVATDRGMEQYAGSGPARTHPVGTKWRFVLTAGILAGDSDDKAHHTDVVLAASTTWKDTNSALDMTLRGVEPGHRVVVEAALQWQSSATAGFADFVSVVSGSPVNGWGQRGAEDAANVGILGLRCNSSEQRGIGATAQKVVVSGDLGAGSSDLLLRLRANQSSATAKTIAGAAGVPILVNAYNRGFRRKPVVYTAP